MTGQNNELIQFRVKRAQDTLEDARILFERRQESDYVDFVSFESSLIDPLMKKAESFVECVAKLIEANT